MSTLTTTTGTSTNTNSTPTTGRAASAWRATAVAGVVAAAVTTAAAAAAHAAGVSFEVEGEMIPLLGFAQMTLVGAVLGGVILASLNRWSAAPRRRLIEVTTALTALSCVPSVAMPDDAASKVVLVALHVLAAVIVVPALARHARD